MLTRWHLLLGSTFMLGALLLVGCGGHNSNPPQGAVTLESLLPLPDDHAPNRGRGDAEVRLVMASPVKVEVEDDDGIVSIGVVWLFPNMQWGRQLYRPGGSTTFSFPLPYFGQADYAFTIQTRIGLDSWYSVTRNGQLIRRWP